MEEEACSGEVQVVQGRTTGVQATVDPFIFVLFALKIAAIEHRSKPNACE